MVVYLESYKKKNVFDSVWVEPKNFEKIERKVATQCFYVSVFISRITVVVGSLKGQVKLTSIIS